MADALDPAELQAKALNQTFGDSFDPQREPSEENHIIRGSRRKRQFEAKLLLQMMEIDREDTFTIMGAWEKFLRVASDTGSADEIKTFDE
ncbi:uncharacterized protein N7529_003614 [Penicillium soppii]|uniref:uncharacterized protein n=1 Tax=Penicillium soppii TaxID=69789 RepID=UPI0025493909|nr:uncharacterized protein N7529_003614 [Penicillium soppii]KAJ5871261.1 hypothetical protein N7529_003614 [Penicillium soppii]